MNQKPQVPIDIRLVSAEPIPDKLFVCSAKIKPEATLFLKNAFTAKTVLSGYFTTAYNNHLAYVYNLGDKYYQVGPSADFTEILYIFAMDSLEEAQKLMHNDPFYEESVFYDDSWFPWEIHSPRWKIPAYFRQQDRNYNVSLGVIPKYPPDFIQPVEEVKVDAVTPNRLFACFSKINREILNQVRSPKENTQSSILMQHIYNCSGQGGAGTMGYHWLSGPSVDYTQDLTIFSVNSLLMAQLIKENDAFSRYGVFYDFRYFEWCIHMPLRKASPQHKDTLKQFLKSAGIKLIEK